MLRSCERHFTHFFQRSRSDVACPLPSAPCHPFPHAHAVLAVLGDLDERPSRRCLVQHADAVRGDAARLELVDGPLRVFAHSAAHHHRLPRQCHGCADIGALAAWPLLHAGRRHGLARPDDVRHGKHRVDVDAAAHEAQRPTGACAHGGRVESSRAELPKTRPSRRIKSPAFFVAGVVVCRGAILSVYMDDTSGLDLSRSLALSRPTPPSAKAKPEEYTRKLTAFVPRCTRNKEQAKRWWRRQAWGGERRRRRSSASLDGPRPLGARREQRREQ